MVTFARDGQSHNDDEQPTMPTASAGDEIGHLHRALQSQPVIEQAKGLLMAQHGCTPDEAFAMLMRASQRENRKLRDVARAMIDGSSSGAVIGGCWRPMPETGPRTPGTGPPTSGTWSPRSGPRSMR